MNEADDTIETPHGRLDRAALQALENSYDTRRLLKTVEQLDQLLGAARNEGGLRDVLLRLHGMAHTVINGAGLSADTRGKTLPELAFDATSEIREWIGTLQRWIKQIEPLEGLQPRD